MVGDPWQGKGLGLSLLEKCLSIASKRGFETIYGMVLGENKSMLALGKKLGFKIERVPNSSEYQMAKSFPHPCQ
jgi:acetyltransferase